MSSTKVYRDQERLEGREKRKKEIIQVAWDLFQENGFPETTMANVATEAKISRKTLYQYFKSKEEIAFEIEVEVFQSYIRIMDQVIPTLKGSGYEKLKAYFEVIDKNLDRHKNAIRFTGIFDFNLKDDYPNEPIVETFIDVIHRSNGYLNDILLEGMEDGSIRNDIDPVLTAETISDSWLCLSQRVFSRKDNLDRVHGMDSRKMITHQMDLFSSALKK